jgi:hypothetical protein
VLVDYYQGKELKFEGKVRAGFTPQVRQQVRAKLDPLCTAVCSFADLPTREASRWGGGVTVEQMRETVWTT